MPAYSPSSCGRPQGKGVGCNTKILFQIHPKTIFPQNPSILPAQEEAADQGRCWSTPARLGDTKMTPLGQPTLPAGAAVTQSPAGEQGLFVGMSQHRARDTNSPQLPGLRCHTKPRLSQQDNARLWGTVTVPSPFPPPTLGS